MDTIKVITSQREQFVDITNKIQSSIVAGFSGICIVYVPHTTAGVTINEHADSDVAADMLDHLGELVPRKHSFRHAEGNSDAHIKASIIGSSVSIIVEDGNLLLGTWQGIFFAEFDGPRSRKVCVKFV